ncbi:hypothetical protein [Corynebacterium crudilactis]|uniref:Uncharacterized protein n=1 Tax=Corynebacterium crudilactis TaxID=1652495 RepID=A0A172QVQ2_9CORY|nr:hypothetical protein [Corynebacterium crudilactis]ANE04710.1 hypothetical protein ccrud_11205 [Corynebacterium crudilactis]
MQFDPVSKWVSANIHRALEEFPVTKDEALKTCFRQGQYNLKLEYRISGRKFHKNHGYADYSLRFNPWTLAQKETSTDTNGEETSTATSLKLTSDGWFEPGQAVTKSILVGTPQLLPRWKQFVTNKLYSRLGEEPLKITMLDAGYLKFTQAATEDELGWGLLVDLSLDCGLYFCRYSLDQVIHQEVEASSVHLWLSGEDSFREYEKDDSGELTGKD